MARMNLVEDLITKASLAPSSHNTQPWIFEAEENEIRLFADRTRALSVNDPYDRELTISCGCALLNLRVAAAELEIPLVVEKMPDEGDSDYLARVRLDGVLDESLGPLGTSISLRRTYRKKFEKEAPGQDIVDRLLNAADAEGAWLEPLNLKNREVAGQLVAEGDLAQWGDPRWRRELANWMHPRRSGDGLTLPWLAIPIAQLVIRTFDMGKGVGAKDSDIAEHSPLLMVLGTSKDNPSEWLRAGQALERVLLAATKDGLQASYLNQPIQVADLRSRLQALCEQVGVPQILLRIGRPADEIDAAPRRAFADTLRP